MTALEKDQAYQTYMRFGQRAQAHATEAARLHAAAAEIQAAALAGDSAYYLNHFGMNAASVHGWAGGGSRWDV